jgi:four helix bundle protein
MAISSYQDLRVWQEGMNLAVASYRLTAQFPREEAFGLTSQIRRAASSVPANIAEGYGRSSSASYAEFLKVARGSLNELQTHVLLATRIGIVEEASVRELVAQADQLGKQISSLIRTLKPDTNA